MSKHGPYLDVTGYGLLAEPRYYFYGWTADKRVRGRKSAILALLRAQKALPKGLRFKVWDFQRPRRLQQVMIKSFVRRFRHMNPGLTARRLDSLVLTYAAPPLPDSQVTRRDCHRNGGAVDITIVDAAGNELYMGTDHDDLTEKAYSLHYENRKKLTRMEREARDNRRVLRRAMESAGWQMLPSEWWHWSTQE